MILARVFIPFGLGYFLSYLVRVVNAVLAPDLVRDLGLSADELGLLTSAALIAFAAFQLPLGILLDRFGPRRTEAALFLFCAAGAFLSATAGGVGQLMTGRALIGLGTSACLMAAFKAYTLWFDAARMPLVNGCHMVAGGLGALAGTVPVEMALGVTDWRGVFWVFGAMALGFAGLIYFMVPRRGGTDSVESSLAEQIDGVVSIFKSPVFWRVAPVTVTTQAAFIGIQTLWAGPWMSDVAGMPRDAVADTLFLVAAAMAAGFFTMGALAERAGRFGVPPIFVALAGMALFIAVQLGLVLQWVAWTRPLWIAFGFLGTASIVIYAIMPQRFDKRLAGRVLTGMNLMVFSLGFAVQWGIGVIIDQWPAGADGGFHPDGYGAGFAAVAALQALSLAWYALYRKETPAKA
ncbi:MAG: MFS transporter [Magnetovibrio sp.]|nr:MFS transporter [Magnetovibrio sp.]